MGRRKASARREPVFDVHAGSDAEPVRQREKRQRAEARASASARKGKAAAEARAVRLSAALVYWGAVAALWAGDRRHRRRRLGRRASAAAPVAGNPEAAAVDPDRRPQRPAARDARRHGRRSRSAARNCRAYVPQAFIAIEDRRFHSHFGVDPIGLARALGRQRHAPRRGAGRLDHHPAARQEPVPDAGAHARRARCRRSALALWLERKFTKDRDPRALSQPRLFRRRRLRHRGRGAALFQQAGAAAHAGRSRDARRPRAVAVAARAEAQLRTAPSGARRSCSPPWRTLKFITDDDGEDRADAAARRR